MDQQLCELLLDRLPTVEVTGMHSPCCRKKNEQHFSLFFRTRHFINQLLGRAFSATGLLSHQSAAISEERKETGLSARRTTGAGPGQAPARPASGATGTGGLGF